MIGGLRQLRAIWAHAGGLRRIGKVLTNKAVLRGAADVGSDVAFKGLKLARRSKKGSLIGRAFRSRKLRKGMFTLDVASSLGWVGLGAMEYQNLKKTHAARQTAVRRFQSNLNRTEQRLQRVRRVTDASGA